MIFKEFTTDEGKDMKVRGDKEELVRGSKVTQRSLKNIIII